jgi:FkbH-like protein
MEVISKPTLEGDGLAIAAERRAASASAQLTAERENLEPEPREKSALNGAPVRVALLADCLAAYRLEVLTKVAGSRGMVVEGVASTVTDLDGVDWQGYDLVILFPWTYNVLSPIWSLAAIQDETARVDGVQSLKDYLTATIRAVAAQASGCLVLVQGLAGPPLLPHGRMEFRSKMNYGRVLFEINDHICELIRDSPNMFFVDEERLFANLGKRQLLDHASSFYTQYISCAYNPGQGRSDLLLGPMIVIAREYLNFFAMWNGRGKIKCIITDLDNTLWPGEIGEGTLQADILDIAMSHFGGLHEALKLMKQRGILLATCSKNTIENVLGPWAELADAAKALGFEHFLKADDFVLHKINWELKSDNIRDIASTLGFKTDSLLFIDDHPAEREEVKQALPEVTILDSQSSATRYELLGDPRMEMVSLTQESRSRTEMTRAQLMREEERRSSVDPQSFLRSLRIKVKVKLDRTENRLDRIAELIQRTNQFNTTQTRHDVSALRTIMANPDTELYTMEVADKFTDYGLIGVCLIRAGEIDTFVMSCRVLGLKVETALLVSAMRFGLWAGGDVRGRINETQWNQPCRRLFLQAGFTVEADGWYVCRQGQGLATIDPNIYEVTVTEEGARCEN